MTDKIIEIGGNAIWEVGAADDLTIADANFYFEAALKAIQDAGYAVVPVEPTKEVWYTMVSWIEEPKRLEESWQELIQAAQKEE